MIIIIKQDHEHGLYILRAGQQVEVTRELGHSLVALGKAEEVQPAMMDAHTFNQLMSSVGNRTRMAEPQEEEEE
jgi:hypothetical protein